MMTDDEFLEIGRKSENILNNDDFNALYSTVVENIKNEILVSAKTADERESLYQIYNGMRSFLDRLVAYVSVADRIKNKNNDNSDDFDT